MSWTKTETITTTDQKTGKDHSKPMRTQSEEKCEWPLFDSSSSAESNGMRGVSFLSQLHYQGKQIKSKAGRFLSQLHYQGKQIKSKAGRFALFFSRVWLISRVGPRVYPRLKIQETYACAATVGWHVFRPLFSVCDDRTKTLQSMRSRVSV